MVEQRKHFFNKFDDFQALIEELKNYNLIVVQRFERHGAQLAKQAKIRADEAKARAE